MSVTINILQNSQAKFLTNDIIEGRKSITQRLITGERANPAEDPAKDSLAAKMDIEMNSMRVARESIEAAKAILGIAASGVKTFQKMMMSLEETRAKSQSGEISDSERVLLDQHFQSYKNEANRIVNATKYGDKKLIDGSLSGGNTIETNTTGILENSNAENTLEYNMIKTAGMLNVNGVKFEIVNAAAAPTTSIIMKKSEEVQLSLKDLATADLKATAETALKVAGIGFKLLTGTPGTPAAGAIEVQVPAAGIKAEDLASKLAAIINNPTGQEATVVDALKGMNAKAVGGALVISKEGKAAAAFDVGFGSATAGDLTNKVVSSIRLGGTTMSINSAKDNTFSTREMDGAELITITEEVGKTDGSHRQNAAKEIAKLIQNVNAKDAAGRDIIQNQITKDLLSALSARVDGKDGAGGPPPVDEVATLILTAKNAGVSGSFSVIEDSIGDAAAVPPVPASSTTYTSQYSEGAKVGSLGLSSVRVTGSIPATSILKGLDSVVATSGFVDINKDLMVDGAVVSIGGRNFNLREKVINPEVDIQVKALDPLQTLNNIATFFNNSADPTVGNYYFEVNGDRTQAIHQLKFTARTPDESVNRNQVEISKTGFTEKATLTLAGGSAGGVNTAKITDNAGFLGKVQGFKAVLDSPNKVKLQLVVGDYTYEGFITDTTLAKETTVIMASNSTEGGRFTLSLNAGKGMAVSTKEEAAVFAKKFDEAFDQLKFYQTRKVDSFKPQDDSVTNRTIVEFVSAAFEKGVNVDRVEVEGSYSTGKASIKISLNDGRKYKSGDDLGNSITESQRVELIKIADPKETAIDTNEKLLVRFGQSINLTDANTTKRFEADLTRAFQADKSPLQFQTGTEISDKISFSIGGLDFADQFSDKDFHIKTRTNAETLAPKIKDILNKCIEVDAQIGAAMNSAGQVADSLTSQILGLEPIQKVFKYVDMLDQLEQYTENSNKMTIAINMLSEIRTNNTFITNKLFQFG